ncbi:hypothetical protein ACFLTQ_00990 [Chloroflexota bacterium]
MDNNKLLLVGDNPFLGVSHLSQERAITRDNDLQEPKYCAKLVTLALNNGANGFMFTVNERTLEILRYVKNSNNGKPIRLYSLVPYVPEFVRLAATSGGIPGLAVKLGRQIIFSGNVKALAHGAKGVITNNPADLIKSYLMYEIFRLRSATGREIKPISIMWHEVITDMAISLNMRWFFNTHINFMIKKGIKPGFETRNLSFLVKRFEEWGIDLGNVSIAAPFNATGFQMCPSKDEYEKALSKHPEAEIIGFSILAAGYLNLNQATEYIKQIPDIKGIAVGVSKEHHARETFKTIQEQLNK